MTNKEWFKQAGFGMMVHFGLYSLIGGEWNGRRTPLIGEWAQSYFRIPNREYERLAQAFNPVLFCADDWVQLAQEAGMQYIVVTAKHHEGFALFDTNYDHYNCVTGAPFGRDLIAELAEACAKHNMKLGLYYLPCPCGFADSVRGMQFGLERLQPPVRNRRKEHGFIARLPRTDTSRRAV